MYIYITRLKQTYTHKHTLAMKNKTLQNGSLLEMSPT